MWWFGLIIALVLVVLVAAAVIRTVTTAPKKPEKNHLGTQRAKPKPKPKKRPKEKPKPKVSSSRTAGTTRPSYKSYRPRGKGEEEVEVVDAEVIYQPDKD